MPCGHLAPGAAVTTATMLPAWSSPRALARVTAELRDRAPLVRFRDCLRARDQLARAAAGKLLVLQAGDCAELFADVSQHTTACKVMQLSELAQLLSATTGLPVLRIGRIAGQFAKPRSQPVERTADGSLLPVYRGDAVNSLGCTAAARIADPRRMLAAYDKSELVLRHLVAHQPNDKGEVIYTSHEAFLVEYEEPLIRRDPQTGMRYGASAHLLWAGDRTRHADGPHVGLLARIANPVAVKLGPSATPAAVAALVGRLNPNREPGRLTLIARLGADGVGRLLPPLVAAARACGGRPTWVCDPMHGNTVRTGADCKIRALDDIIGEVVSFTRVLAAAGEQPGGIHLEVTPYDVTECVARREQALSDLTLPRYWTACDPRLNPDQARQVVSAFARELRACLEHRVPSAVWRARGPQEPVSRTSVSRQVSGRGRHAVPR